MPLSSSNTGSTDLRDTEVQQPNTAAHLSTDSRPRAFSANSGQLEAGSTTTASNLRPSTPPLAFCCSISMSMTSFSVVSLIAMVPESECRMPTLIGPVCAAAGENAALTPPIAATVAAATPRPPRRRRVSIVLVDTIVLFPVRSVLWRGGCLGSPSREVQPSCHKAVRRRAPRPGESRARRMRNNQASRRPLNKF